MHEHASCDASPRSTVSNPSIHVPVGGRTLRTNMKMAFSGLTLMRFRMTYTNWPTVRSAGTRYLRGAQSRRLSASAGLRGPKGGCFANHTHFFLSMSGMSLFSAFSTMTCGGQSTGHGDFSEHVKGMAACRGRAGHSPESCRDTSRESLWPQPGVSLRAREGLERGSLILNSARCTGSHELVYPLTHRAGVPP